MILAADSGNAWRLPAGAASGVLLALALPKPDLYVLGWVALVPLLLALGRSGPKIAAATGYAAGLTFFGGVCYWIVSTMNTYGGLSFGLSVGVFVLFVLVFAAHFALFAFVLEFFIGRWGIWALALAAPLWVAVELVQGWLIFGGFPWMLAGYALVPYPGLLQMVSWTGVYGLSFFLVAVNAAIAAAIRSRDPRPGAGAAALVVLAILLPAPTPDRPEESFRVQIVQTRIPIDFTWGGAEEDALLDELILLSSSQEAAPDLVVWPETPAPFYLGSDPVFQARIGDLARGLGAYVLVGYIDSNGSMPSNSAGLVSPSGQQVSRYDKIHLVPFGEYVPLKRLFFFAESLVRNVGDFAPGTDLTVSAMGPHRFATTICYEDVFPALMRRFPALGAEAIVNITNDGWFGSSSAPYQHLRMARVRAVESRRYLVRAANTGISAIIDPYGNVVASTGLGERTTLDGEAGYRTDLTFYVRFGDVFAAAAASVVGLALIAARRRPGRPRSRSAPKTRGKETSR